MYITDEDEQYNFHVTHLYNIVNIILDIIFNTCYFSCNITLYYCNSLFRSLSKFNLHRLQSIQNSAARIVTNLSKYTSITPVLRKLHWLPVQFRSEFKLATLVYKFIHTAFPKYFAPYLSTYRTTYNSRCSQSVANFFNVPKFQPTFHKSTRQFGFSFAFDAPTVWNSLPEDIRASPTIASFRRKLKTYRKGLSFLAHFLLWLLRGADLLLFLDFEFAYCYCLVAP